MTYSNLLLTKFLPAAMFLVSASVFGTTYFVSSSGLDENTGLSPEQAWNSLTRVNTAALLPGDSVLFRRGDVWRGQLVPQSGGADAPVVYGAFGQGEKPVF
ncbi:hypothetical protein JW948_17560, partial [bacterium]|nr:hypothetical protein [bacterium]